MQFKDRREAGEKLVKKLDAYKGATDATVVALPRGGVVLGRMIADALGLPLDVVVTRKISAPGQPEYAIGAVNVGGEVVWNQEERSKAGTEYCEKAMRDQMTEAKRRLEKYRNGWPPRDLRSKTVIIVDDGIATGYTMRAAIMAARSEGAKKIVIAVPVAPLDTLATLSSEADEIITLYVPEMFTAIGGFYTDFSQFDDQTVIDLLSRK